MKLNELLEVLHLPTGRVPPVEISEISMNSAQVQPGDVFVAVTGFHVDGHEYISDAIKAGACAVIGERAHPPDCAVPYLQVPDSRLAVARLSAARYGYPHNRHIMTGITGTNGKTTTAYMLRHILESTQRSCSLFGTVER